MTGTAINENICIMSQDQIGDLREAIGQINGTMSGVLTSTNEQSLKLERILERMANQEHNVEQRLDKEREWVTNLVQTTVNPINKNVSFLKDKYWIFVGVIITVNTLILLGNFVIKFWNK